MRMFTTTRACGLVLLATSVMSTTASGQPALSQDLGAVRLPTRVLADGQPIAPGTYEIRLTQEQPTAAAGQTPAATRWVEFLRNGRVVGRDLAILLERDARETTRPVSAPGANRARIDVLRGSEYVRIWINRRDVDYLVHLPLTP